MILGISLRVPFILVLTLQGQKSPVFVFYCFRDLYELKLTGDFSSINILPIMMELSFETTQTEIRRGKEYRWCAHPLGAPPMLLGASCLRSRPSKAPEGSPDQKNQLYKGL